MTQTRATAPSGLSARLGVAGLAERLAAVRVPAWSFPHLLAAVVLWLFLLDVASGIPLLLFYRPDASAAHDSVVTIVGMPHGALIRGVHAWTSQLLIAALGGQVAALLFSRRFTPPREVLWWSSLLLLVLGCTLSLSGGVLPWSQRALLQALVSSDLLEKTPLIGGWLVTLIQGGPEVSGWTLHHAYGFHTGALPALTSLLLAVYLFLLLRLSPRSGEPAEVATIPLYPDFAVRAAAACVAVLMLVMSLALFAAPPIGAPAALDAPPPGAAAAPPWYLLFLHQLLLAAPPTLLGVDSPTFVMGGLTLVAAAVFAVPLLDRRGSRATRGIGIAALIVWLALTAHALS
jgi:quinol-cytochrome oxidoreductase complex cytochrome b subunit